MEVGHKNFPHNYEASRNTSGQPCYLRFSSEEIQRIQEMTKEVIPLHQILTSLRQGNLNLQAISRTLYNVRAKIKKESLNGLSNFQVTIVKRFVYHIIS